MTRNVLFLISICSLALFMNTLCLNLKKAGSKLKTKTCNVPLIAVLANPNPHDADEITQANINYDYVTWIKHAGARIVPLMPWETDDNIRSLIKNKLNGIIIQSNIRYLKLHGSFEKKVNVIIKAVIEEYKNKNVVPLWGMGQGAELIQFLLSGAKDSKKIAINITGVQGKLISSQITDKKSEIFKYFDWPLLSAYERYATTLQLHNSAVDVAAYKNKNLKLSEYLTITSIAKDTDGTEFVNTFEGKDGLPIYGSQFNLAKMYTSDILESTIEGDWRDAMLISRAFVNFIHHKAITSEKCVEEQDFKQLEGFGIRGIFHKHKKVDGQEYYFYNNKSHTDQPYIKEKPLRSKWDSFI